MNFEINITQIICAIAVAIIGAVVRYFIPWLKSNTSEKVYNILEMACSSAVYFAQQWYKQEDGEKKKEEAMKYAEAYLAERGIVIDLDVVSDCIEAELKRAKIDPDFTE